MSPGQPSEFLPSDYKIPTGGKYLRPSKIEGRVKMRILTSPIFGSEGWVVNGGQNRPVRKAMGQSFAANEIGEDPPQHFWAMPIWNYETQEVQVLQITQKTIMGKLKNLASSADWGSPVKYDITVVHDGQGRESEYDVLPSPPSPLPKEATEAWEKLEGKFDLNRLFSNGDPFGDVVEAVKLDSGSDDIPF